MENEDPETAVGRRGDAALEKGLDLYIAIASNGSPTAIRWHSERLQIPLSTARRMVATLVRKGLVVAVGRGEVRATSPLAFSADQGLAAAASLPVRRLARALRKTVHLGVLDSGMVTYLLKEDGGSTRLFTRPANQLEAYCSALGKLLLANLPADQQEAYLAEGPFIALTDNTITSPESLRAAFQQILRQGFASDDGEIAEGLRCVAVPVRDGNGHVIAALSCSQVAGPLDEVSTAGLLDKLSACAASVTRRLGPMLSLSRPSPL